MMTNNHFGETLRRYLGIKKKPVFATKRTLEPGTPCNVILNSVDKVVDGVALGRCDKKGRHLIKMFLDGRRKNVYISHENIVLV